MRIRARLVLFVGVAAIVPLALVTVAVVRETERAVTDALLRAEIASAQATADAIGRRLDDVTRLVRVQVGGFRLDTATDEARQAFIVATWRLLPEGSAAGLVDASGVEVVPWVGFAVPSTTLPDVIRSAAASRVTADPEGSDPTRGPRSTAGLNRAERSLAALPAPGAPGEVVVGTPRVEPDANGAVVALVGANAGGDGLALAVEVPFAAMSPELDATAGVDREVALLTVDGQVLARAGRTDLLEIDRVRPLLGSGTMDFRYTTVAGAPVLAASAPVAAQPWVVVVVEPVAAVGVTAAAIRARAAYIGVAAILFAVAAGWSFAASLTRPVVALHRAARALGRGAFDARVDTDDGAGELAELGAAFNRMAADLGAQAQRVQGGQVAAVGELASGLAHALNNPLTGVLSAVQLASDEARALGPAAAGLAPFLEVARGAAEQCRKVLQRVGRVSETGTVEVPRVVDLRALVASAAPEALCRAGTIAALGHHGDGPAWIFVDVEPVRGFLVQLFLASRGLSNATSITTWGVSLRGRYHVVRIEVSPARTDDDALRAAGLDLWSARVGLATCGAVVTDLAAPGMRGWELSFAAVERSP